jgi:hypothetical protein
MKISKEDAIHCSNVFKEYFDNMESIEQYMRDEKMKSLDSIPSSLFPPEDDLFSDFTMHPNDMDIELVENMPNGTWETLMKITSSHINKAPVGRNIQLAVRERNTQKVLGFIRLGSPLLYMKPRNEMLGQVWLQQSEWAKKFNDSTIMGFVIVPSQPFGFNYLGGKLLSAICTSHKVREIVNKKYDMNLCLFETTSLYGSSKTVSQYDGMKPFIKYRGLSVSDSVPMMHGIRYNNLKKFVEDKIGGDILGTCTSTTSRKMRTFVKIIALTKSALKGLPEYDEFLKTIDNAKSLTEQKRYYSSDYGFKNTIDYVNCKTDTLIPGENYDKHDFDNVIKWWKVKATNRYETLKSEGRLRTELEIWTSGKHIDIIR